MQILHEKVCLQRLALRTRDSRDASKAHDLNDKFRCPVCYQKATSVSDLVQHMKIANHNTEGVKCPRCSGRFGIVELQAHFQSCVSTNYNILTLTRSGENCYDDEGPESYYDEKRKLFCAWDSSKSKCLEVRDAQNNVCCQKKPLEGCNDLMKGRCPEQYQVNLKFS